MDHKRFDELARIFATNAIVRRRAIRTLVASLVSAIIPLFGDKHAGAQTTCKPVGSKCSRGAQCCSGLCNRRGRCVCKQLGQSCTKSRNCCADATGGQTCQGGKCCRQPGFGCTGNTECCSRLCCNGFCCHPTQICEAGEGGQLECTCDVLVGEEPCGLVCCTANQECRNNTACCTLIDKPCSRHAQCCSGNCPDGRCRPQRCELHSGCDFPRERCCQGKCVPCPSGGECQNDICRCGPTNGNGFWCPPSGGFPDGQCCAGSQTVNCCQVGGSNDGDCFGAGTSCPSGSVPAKPWPQE